MTYLRPETLGEALQALSSQKLKVLAGGTDVYPALRDRPLSEPTLDLTQIAGIEA